MTTQTTAASIAGQVFYHVAGPHYQAGDDLLCWDTLLDAGIVTEDDWHWDANDAECGYDGWAICVFADRSEAEAFAAEYNFARSILTITVPTDYDPCDSYFPRHDRVSEGYRCFVGRIPAEWLS